MISADKSPRLRINVRVTQGQETDVDVMIVRLGILPTKHPVRTANTEVVLDMALVDVTGAKPWKRSVLRRRSIEVNVWLLSTLVFSTRHIALNSQSVVVR